MTFDFVNSILVVMDHLVGATIVCCTIAIVAWGIYHVYLKRTIKSDPQVSDSTIATNNNKKNELTTAEKNQLKVKKWRTRCKKLEWQYVKRIERQHKYCILNH